MLKIYHSNKIEVLSLRLVECLMSNPLPPLVSENVLVESPAMSHWLTKQVAVQTGIAANIEYPFPAALIWNIYRRLMPDLPERSSFDRLSLNLRIFSLLTALSQPSEQQDYDLAIPTHSFRAFKQSSLGAYCQQIDKPKDLFVLANHIAGLFDQYQIYRPDWLQSWAANNNVFFSGQAHELAQWQAELWQWLNQLDNLQADPDRAKIFEQALSCLDALIIEDADASHALFADMPRLHGFALSNLPSSYLQLIEKLSHWVDVIIYALNPSVYFWQGALSQQQMLAEQFKQGTSDTLAINTLNIERSAASNELLVQLAKQPQAYLTQLLTLKAAATEECFIELDDNTLLQQCQNSITKLEQYPDKRRLNSLDTSIEVHSCHNRLREVEVLQQNILQVLDDNPSWRQGDIAVIVPDVDSYAPYFHAVFGSASAKAKPQALLYYAVSEKNSLQQNSLSAALVKFMALIPSNFTHSEVLSFLSESCVHQYFGLQTEQMQTVEQLLVQCNVCFGLQDTTQVGAASITRNADELALVDVSFAQAKARLLSSFYAPEAVNQIDEMLSPLLPHIEHERANIAGQLCEFIDQLQLCVKRFARLAQGNAPVDTWLETFIQCARNTMCFDGDFEEAASQVLNSLQKVEEQANLSRFQTSAGNQFQAIIDVQIFSVLVNDALSSGSQNFYFNDAAINIAGFLPLQSVPFKMIAVLGMNDGEFPVIAPRDQLDLMVHQTRLGDRHKVDEQRGQFLQALLSARDKFYVSFLGRNQYDNTEQFPSLLLKELIQFLDNNFYLEQQPDLALSEQLIKQHALQAFSPEYYSLQQPKHNSCNEFYFEQAQALQGEKTQTDIFAKVDKTVASNLGMQNQNGDNPFQQLSLAELIRGLNNPSLQLLRQQGIFLNEESLDVSDTELFSTDALNDFLLRDFRLTQQDDNTSTTTQNLTAFIRKGLLPQAEIGRQNLQRIDHDVAQLKELLVQHHLNDFPDSQSMELELFVNQQPLTFSVALDQIHAGKKQQLALTCNKLRGRHVLKAYLMHLCACAYYGSEAAVKKNEYSDSFNSYILSLEGVYKFSAIEAKFAKETLVYYIEQLIIFSQQPSFFFVGSSFDYFSKLPKGEEPAEKLCKQSLLGSDRTRGEMEDVHHRYAYRGIEIDITRVIEQAIHLFEAPFELLENLSDDAVQGKGE